MAIRRFNEPSPEVDLGEATSSLLESRQSPRVAANFSVELHSSVLQTPLVVQVRDISTGGLCVATASPIALDSISSVVVDLPEARMRLSVEGKWQANLGLDEAVLSGLVFGNLKPNEVSALWDLVERTSRGVGAFLYESLQAHEASIDDAMSLAKTTRTRIVPRGRLIYRRHERPEPIDDSIFIVRGGSLELTVPIRPGREVKLGRVGIGEVLGGLGSVTSLPPIESAQTNEESVLLEISKAAFSYILVAKPLLGLWLGRVVLASHLRRVDSVVTRLGELD